MIWFLANWKLFAVGGLVLAVFSSGWYVESRFAETRQKEALAAQETVLHKQCDDEKAITKEANDGLQKNLATISAKLSAAKRLHTAMCITPASKLAQPSASGGEHAGQNGISSDFLREFAAECESYRSEVIILNDFGLAERKQH